MNSQENVNSDPDFSDVKVGSLVYHRHYFSDDEWETGIVVEKVDPDLSTSRINAWCFKILYGDSEFQWRSLRELMLIEAGEK